MTANSSACTWSRRSRAAAGGRLLETALAWLEHEGPRTLWLGVWSENFGAQRLRPHGFEKAGEYLFPVGDTQDLESSARARLTFTAACRARVFNHLTFLPR